MKEFICLLALIVSSTSTATQPMVKVESTLWAVKKLHPDNFSLVDETLHRAGESKEKTALFPLENAWVSPNKVLYRFGLGAAPENDTQRICKRYLQLDVSPDSGRIRSAEVHIERCYPIEPRQD